MHNVGWGCAEILPKLDFITLHAQTEQTNVTDRWKLFSWTTEIYYSSLTAEKENRQFYDSDINNRLRNLIIHLTLTMTSA